MHNCTHADSGNGSLKQLKKVKNGNRGDARLGKEMPDGTVMEWLRFNHHQEHLEFFCRPQSVRFMRRHDDQFATFK
jgi:hypothetical protein